MLRAIQSLGSVSGVVSSPLHRWKSGRRRGGFCFISVSIESASDSRRAAPSFVFPLVSTRRTARLGGAFRMSTIRSDMNLDAAAAAASSSPSSPSTSFQSSGHIHKIKFCQLCGGPTKYEIPAGEEKMRAICTLCGKIAYQNPKMVVGCLVEHENRVLLCKRKIQPSYGLWTLPAGYLEIGESAAEGAIRETWEEACAEVEVLSPFAQLDIPRIGQTYIIFRARMKKPHFLPGPESLECRLFSLDEIPFNALAFSSMMVTLNLYIEDVKMGKLKFHYGTINKRAGSSPSDVHGYTLDYHLIS